MQTHCAGHLINVVVRGNSERYVTNTRPNSGETINQFKLIWQGLRLKWHSHFCTLRCLLEAKFQFKWRINVQDISWQIWVVILYTLVDWSISGIVECGNYFKSRLDYLRIHILCTDIRNRVNYCENQDFIR